MQEPVRGEETPKSLRDEKEPIISDEIRFWRGKALSIARAYRCYWISMRVTLIVIGALSTIFAGISVGIQSTDFFKYAVLILTALITALNSINALLRLSEIPPTFLQAANDLTELLYSFHYKFRTDKDTSNEAWRRLESETRQQYRAIWFKASHMRFTPPYVKHGGEKGKEEMAAGGG